MDGHVVGTDEAALDPRHRAEEAHHEVACGLVVEVAWPSGLLDSPGVQQHDGVGKLHRLLLIVRDQHRRHMHLVVQSSKPRAKLGADVAVQGAERLVQQ